MSKRRFFAEVAVWTASVFVALVCLRSGLMKMPGVPGEQFWARDFQRWGYPDWFRIVVGLAELAAFASLLVPRAAAYGAGLFGAVMVGAIFTHATHGESSRLPFNVVLLTLSLGIAVARLSARRHRAARSE
jgi:putative oxidoreductase